MNKQYMYQVDQSGKIEQTNKNTVICLSNSVHRTIMLKAKDKRELQNIYRAAGKPKVFSIQLFSALIYLLIEKSRIKEGVIYIDKEYPGHEDIIKSYITQLISRRGKSKQSLSACQFDQENIRFTLVGKTSNAHLIGYRIWKKGKADFIATKDDILAMVLNYES